MIRRHVHTHKELPRETPVKRGLHKPFRTSYIGLPITHYPLNGAQEPKAAFATAPRAYAFLASTMVTSKSK